MVANFSILKTVTLSVHAGLFGCCPNPPNSDMDYRIFNVRMWSSCIRIHTGDFKDLSQCVRCARLKSLKTLKSFKSEMGCRN